jgi:hypothetical protein
LLSAPTATQVLALQQPAQLAGPQSAVHTPFWQVEVPEQEAQATPFAPQRLLLSLPIPSQTLPLQHPAQLPAPHTP